MSEIFIRFQGFHPTEFTRAFLDEKLREIQRRAPSGAILKAVFRRKDHVLTASIQIFSAAGRIFARASSVHLREVGHQLSERTRRQLQRWKVTRHE